MKIILSRFQEPLIDKLCPVLSNGRAVPFFTTNLVVSPSRGRSFRFPDRPSETKRLFRLPAKSIRKEKISPSDILHKWSSIHPGDHPLARIYVVEGIEIAAAPLTVREENRRGVHLYREIYRGA